jgi:hypothetical protein
MSQFLCSKHLLVKVPYMFIAFSDIRPFHGISALALALLASGAFAHEHGAHVHGTADLDVAIDEKTVTLSFTSPADNIYGFEHASTNAAESAVVVHAIAALRDPANLFTLNGNCQLQTRTLNLPELGKTEHSDVSGEFSYYCTKLPTQIDLPIWGMFPRMHNLTVDIAAPSGQKELRLQSGQPIILK